MMPHLAPPTLEGRDIGWVYRENNNFSYDCNQPCVGVRAATPQPHSLTPAAVVDMQSLLNKLEQGLGERLDRIEKAVKKVLMGQQQQQPVQEASCLNSQDTGSSAGLDPRSLKLDTAAIAQQLSMTNVGRASCSPNSVGGLKRLFSKKPTVATEETLLECLRNAPSDMASVKSEEEDDPAAAFVLRPMWSVDIGAQLASPSLRHKTTTTNSPHSNYIENDEEDIKDKKWFVILPTSRFRCFWDICMMMIIVHDMAVVPVNLGFNTGNNIISDLLFWPTLLYWTLDIPASFVTGFYRDGHVVVTPYQIALHYLTTWFPLDIIIVVSSWMFLDSSVRGYLLGRAGKGLRAFRIIHSFRILRMAKLRRLAEYFYDHVTSEYYHIVMSMLKYILIIVWLNHFIACVWWFIGHQMLSNGSESWTAQYTDSNLAVQYFTSLHWSLTQFTPASMEVVPLNLAERIFSVVVLLFAMIAFSSFLSSITAAMTQLRTFNQPDQTNFAILRRYLRNHKVHLDLTSRIMHCVTYRLQKLKREISEGQVVFLKFLSKPLQLELANQLYSPTLVQHPFFSCYSGVDPEAMRRVCLEAIKLSTLCTTDLLFTEGGSCEHMYFVTSGQFWYSNRSYDKDVNRSTSSTESKKLARSTVNLVLEEGAWCCEVCIWFPWTHCGSLCAVRMSEVLAVDVPAFINISSSFAAVFNFSKHYAELFSDEVVMCVRDGIPLNDMSNFSIDTLENCVDRAYFRRGGIKGISSMVCGQEDFGGFLERPYAAETSEATSSIITPFSSNGTQACSLGPTTAHVISPLSNETPQPNPMLESL